MGEIELKDMFESFKVMTTLETLTFIVIHPFEERTTILNVMGKYTAGMEGFWYKPPVKLLKMF